MCGCFFCLTRMFLLKRLSSMSLFRSFKASDLLIGRIKSSSSESGVDFFFAAKVTTVACSCASCSETVAANLSWSALLLDNPTSLFRTNSWCEYDDVDEPFDGTEGTRTTVDVWGDPDASDDPFPMYIKTTNMSII